MSQIVHVVTATDGEGFVRDQEVWADPLEAFELFDRWKHAYGGEFVCIASRKVLGAAPAQQSVPPDPRSEP